jgi:hypothetical protein
LTCACHAGRVREFWKRAQAQGFRGECLKAL